MKIKKFIVGGLLIGFATLSAFHAASVYKHGKDFEKELDSSDDSLDDMILFGGKTKNYKGQTMKDLKLGVFYGAMDVDLSEVITDKKDYRMDLTIDNGGLNVIIPDNFKLNLVDHCRFGGISDDTICKRTKDCVSLSVRADVKFGALNFENPESN